MYRVSVDVGGTFTDVVVADAAGQLTLGKALTTPDRSYTGLRSGLEDAANQLGVGVDELLAETGVLIYGTTRSTNAIVQGATAKTAFLTTAGFPNILHYRQGGKERPFDLSRGDLAPYVPGKYTFEIPERINAEGGIERKLDEEAVVEVIASLQRLRIEAVAVCLLWSTVNDSHERRVGQLLDEHLADVPYTLSSALNPVIREYPRASATCIDASLKPLMQAHFRDLRDDLEAAGFRGELLVSASSGGVMNVGDIIERPVYTVKSGPAMAPLAGLHYAAVEGLGDDVIVCDTGGTTFDVSLVRGGTVKFSREAWLMGKWVGHNLGMSTVDVRSIGAGGGSIAWVDAGGLLRVGPESAGSEPGPACYGRGGARPTVTDAAVVLGYIDPDFFLGGRMRLDVGAAERAVADVAGRLGLPVDQTAFGILSIANEEMIKAIREVTINDGINPRESVIVAGGGAAGLNVGPIAASLGCDKVVVPRTAGGLSACGAQYSDIVIDVTASQFARSSDFDAVGVNDALDGLRTRLQPFIDHLAAQGIDRHHLDLSVEARYAGQQWELAVDLPLERFAGPPDVDVLVDSFHRTHERQFAVRDEGAIVECINWKLRLTVELDRPSTPPRGLAATDAPSAARTTRAFFGGDERVDTSVFVGASLRPGHVVWGPAVIEEPTTTIVIYPGMSAEVSSAWNYLMSTR
jgi:N-methylhydantoinase A